jgi:hypothetical protein
MKILRIIACTTIFLNFCFTGAFAQPEMQDLNSVASQTGLKVDSLQEKIVKLDQKIEEGSYTRIPNQDFENIIDNKIEKSLRETLRWWLFVIAALVSVLGFLVNKYAKAYLQTIVDEKVNLLKKENEDKIRSISTRYFSTVIESLLDFKVETITKKNHKVDESVVDDLKNYLNDESLNIPETKKVSLIDSIMRCYYYSIYPQRIEKMIDLIKEYEEKLTLLQTTYVNAAIAFGDMYDRYGNRDFMTSAIENCNKSIKILPDYGLAYALKLELYIMAMSKAFDDADLQQNERDLRKVFIDIDNNKSTYLCKELIDRFEIDKNTFMAPYLDKLYAEFPDEINKILERAKPATV